MRRTGMGALVLHEPSGDELVLERAPDLATVRDDWNRLAESSANVFSTWEWADTWYRHFGAGVRLAVAIGRGPDGAPRALLPLCVTHVQSLRLVRFIGFGPSDQLGPLCAPVDLPAATSGLRRHVADNLGSSGLFLGERLWGADRLGDGLGAITLRRAASPMLPVSGRSFDEFLASRSRNFRDQVRRRERKLARGHRLEYRLTDDPNRLDEDMRTMMRLHWARWSHRQSSAFSGQRESFHLEFAKRALENGWLRLWTMELDGNPVAAWYGLRYAGIESYYQAGRDPVYDAQAVGFVLLCHTIRSAFGDGVSEYRFGLGGESYKDRFAEFDPGLETVAIAAGVRGTMALAAIRAMLRMPERARSSTRRLISRQRAAI